MFPVEDSSAGQQNLGLDRPAEPWPMQEYGATPPSANKAKRPGAGSKVDASL